MSSYKQASEFCSNGCGQRRRAGQRMCGACHAVYMKQWRSERVFVSREMLAAMGVAEFPVMAAPAAATVRKPAQSVAAGVVAIAAMRKPVRRSGAELAELGPMRA